MGHAYPGALLFDSATAVMNNTIAFNRAMPGSGGGGGSGTPAGSPGQNGTAVGGVAARGSSAVVLRNTILANNTPTNGFSAITDWGHNISSDWSCAFTGIGSLNNTDPKLGPLANNGGSTPTLALLPGSPALDAADCASSPATDQRGEPRPGGAACDIGAFELINDPMRIERLTNGNIKIRFRAGPQGSWMLYSSTNLIQWQPVGSNVVNVNGFYEFEDTDTSRPLGRFYKVSVP